MVKFLRKYFGTLISKTALSLIKLITPNKMPQTVIEWRYAQVSFSQFGEDLMIFNALESLGIKIPAVYVDVGAYHPYQYSNTTKLRWYGWSGINIDPSEETIRMFQDERPNDANCLLAINENSGVAQYLKYPIKATCRLSTGPGDDGKSVLGQICEDKRKVRTEPLWKVLDDFFPTDKPFGLLTIDCEGLDLNVLRSNNWEKYTPWIIAVEDHNPACDSQICQYCISLGYKLHAIVHLTKIFIKK